jgi:hypothetical protein
MKNELPNAPEANDPLDALLRDDAENYLPDNGFTARVVAVLPARRRHPWARLVVLSAATLAGAALAAWQLPSGGQVLNALPRGLAFSQWQTLFLLVPFAIALASLAWGISALVAEED